MEFRDLKHSVEKIELSNEMKNRIIQNCRLSAAHEMEEISMKNRVNFKKLMPVAAVLALCICVSAAAASHFGLFKDVTNWSGAVTGTEYVQATDEIEVSAVVEQGILTITADFLSPDTVPYSELETISVGSYQIVDVSGSVIAEGESDDSIEIIDGEAKMTVSLEVVDSGEYKLLINTFIGSKKADQPLKISGSWECDFTV